jgi:sigma-B regulation protein RsbU (phosphoserine phosphatase)
MAAMSRPQFGLTLLALLLLLAGVVAPKGVIGPTFAAGASYALAAVAASALLSVRWTAAIATMTVSVAAVSPVWNHDLGTRDWFVRLAVTILFGGAAVGLSMVRIRQESTLREMTAVAEAAQRAVLRPVSARLGDVRFAARYVSASNAALVGGDLYEVVDSPYGVRVIVGDARGKGIDAVQLSATVMAVFRGGAITEPSMEKIARDLDTVVGSLGEEEDFVTAVLPDRRARASQLWPPSAASAQGRPGTIHRHKDPRPSVVGSWSCRTHQRLDLAAGGTTPAVHRWPR